MPLWLMMHTGGSGADDLIPSLLIMGMGLCVSNDGAHGSHTTLDLWPSSWAC